MRRLRLFSILAMVAIVAVVAAPQAFAQPKVVQTDCDTISLVPPLVRVTFGVINLSPIPVCSVVLIPIRSGPTPADSCKILECSNPPFWQCSVNAVGEAFWKTQPPYCIEPGQKHEPFDIVLDPLFCCYIALFDGPDGQVFHRDIVCFECEKPVAARPSTWGEVKALYR